MLHVLKTVSDDWPHSSVQMLFIDSSGRRTKWITALRLVVWSYPLKLTCLPFFEARSFFCDTALYYNKVIKHICFWSGEKVTLILLSDTHFKEEWDNIDGVCYFHIYKKEVNVHAFYRRHNIANCSSHSIFALTLTYSQICLWCSAGEYSACYVYSAQSWL